MTDPTRLPELHRQRARIAEHLAWLDREIAQADTTAALGDRSPSTVNAAAATESPLPHEGDAQDLIRDWVDENRPTEPLISKTGCWGVFAAVILLGFGGVLAFIALWY